MHDVSQPRFIGVLVEPPKILTLVQDARPYKNQEEAYRREQAYDCEATNEPPKQGHVLLLKKWGTALTPG
jgi:hypothetical protein